MEYGNDVWSLAKYPEDKLFLTFMLEVQLQNEEILTHKTANWCAQVGIDILAFGSSFVCTEG